MFLLVIALLGLVNMLLWNALIPDLFHGPELSYWQALGLVVLTRVLFGFKGPRRHWWKPWHWKSWQKKQWMKEQWHDQDKCGWKKEWQCGPSSGDWQKWAQMSPEEREQAKEEWKRAKEEWKAGFKARFGKSE